jgi:hypothetical protein
MGDLMRRRLWIARVVFLVAAAGLMVAAIDARQDYEDGPTRSVAGITGQRQAIHFDLDDDGRARSFTTVLYHHCSNGYEWDSSWYPSHDGPVPFEWRGDRLEVREPSESHSDDGSSGRGVATMTARETRTGIEGRMRSVWRFEIQGDEYAVCDTGFVPFAAGPGAEQRVGRIEPDAEPWSAYPPPVGAATQLSTAQRVFAARVDRVCLRAWRERPVGRWFGAYVRWHAGELAALRRLGRPADGWLSYGRWLANFERRVGLERRQVAALRDGDLRAAARLSVTIATLKAAGNVEGLGFGLRACTSNGPTGAPRSRPLSRPQPAPPSAA